MVLALYVHTVPSGTARSKPVAGSLAPTVHEQGAVCWRTLYPCCKRGALGSTTVNSFNPGTTRSLEITSNSVVGLHGKVLVAGSTRGGFCEKLLEASPMSDRANASQHEDGPTAGQGQANQHRW